MLFLSPTLFSIIEVLVVLLPALIGVAFVTVAERKTMASMQRRLGPNIVGQIKLIHLLKGTSLGYKSPLNTYNNNIIVKKGKIIRGFSSSAAYSLPLSNNPN